MGREDFNVTRRSTLHQIYAVGTSAPYTVNDPANPGHVLYWVPGTVKLMTNDSSDPYLVKTGFRQSVNTPGFKSPKRPNLLKAQPFTFQTDSMTSNSFLLVDTAWDNAATNGPGTAGYEFSQTFQENANGLPQAPNNAASWVSDLSDKATSNLLNNLKNSNFNAAQAIAERKQTADLVASTATRVAKAYSNLRHGNFAKAASDLGITPPKRAGRRFNKNWPIDQAKAAGNAWLELNYGWKPLLADVYGSMETLARANNPPNGNQNGNVIYHKAKSRAVRKENPMSRTNASIGTNVGSVITVASAQVEVYVRCGITYSVSSPPIQALANVGISNPALLAWELLPYSFVADWFIPIGNYLGQLDAANGLQFYDGYLTVVQKYTGSTVKFTDYHDSSGIKTTHGLNEQVHKSVIVTRKKLNSFPSAPFPKFKNPISTSHVASAMALLLQTFKR